MRKEEDLPIKPHFYSSTIIATRAPGRSGNSLPSIGIPVKSDLDGWRWWSLSPKGEILGKGSFRKKDEFG